MAKKDENILNQLALLPWWVGVGVAAFAYLVLRFVLPSMEFGNPVLNSFAATTPKLAWVAVVFLLPAGFSAFESFRKRELLERQSGIDSIRGLTWREFEELLGEAYRRQGFLVAENSTAGPDGGVDLVITKGGERYLVQCKQWKVVKVGVKVVREMFGLLHAQNASGVIVVTSGLFTQDAKKFAEGKRIELVEGRELVELVRSVQQTPRPHFKPDVSPIPPLPKTCPACGAQLVLRTAKRGKNVGMQFWGCSSFPRCRHTE